MLEWSTACPDWQRRIVAGESLIPCAPLFQDQADAALRVFKELVLVDQPSMEGPEGEAIPATMGMVSRQWLLDFVAQIFGAYDAETGRRLISEFFLCMAKKNAKSTGAAGIMLTALILNWRQSGEFTIISPTTTIYNSCDCAGIAYVGVFDEPAQHSYYQPAWIFSPSRSTKCLAVEPVPRPSFMPPRTS